MNIYAVFPALPSRPTSLLVTNKACVFLYTINDFKDYQQKTNLAKDEEGELHADSHRILMGGRRASVSYWKHMGLIMFGRLENTLHIDTTTGKQDHVYGENGHIYTT